MNFNFMNFNFKSLWILLFSGLSCLSHLSQASDFTYESLPVQENGRIKPLITLARESLQLIHGRSQFEGKSALDIFTTWLLVPQAWEGKNIIEINHHGLKKALGFEKDQKYFPPGKINNHPHLNILFSDLQIRLERKEKLNPYYQAIQRLKAQLFTFYGLSRGSLHVFPPPEESGSDSWISLKNLKPATAEKFFKVMSAYTTQFVNQESSLKKKKSEGELRQAIKDFTEEAKKLNDSYPKVSAMATEVHYQKLDPFFWTWIIYLLATFLYALSFLYPGLKFIPQWGSITLTLGFLFHTYGFILRCLITQRPPVSNMYETVVWVGWGVVLFSWIFYFLKNIAL